MTPCNVLRDNSRPAGATQGRCPQDRVGLRSLGAIVAYFVYTFALTPLFILLANSQAWFHDSRAWIDVNFAQAPLFMFDGAVTGEQWANIGFTAVFWLVIPLAVGLRQVLRSEIT